MIAKGRGLSFLCELGKIRIPYFQRLYVWKEENWEELLCDLLKLEKNHFLGSIILKEVDEHHSGDVEERLVIDGQQRLTTLCILIRVLYNSFDTETQKYWERSLDESLFYKEHRDKNKKFVKILHSRVDNQNYELVINNKIDGNIDRTSRIIECFDYFTKELSKESVEKRKKLFERLFDRNHKILVVIDLGKDDDEQAIFDTINSAGIRLSSADIIKNALFRHADNIMDKKDVEHLYDVYWDSIFTKDDDDIAYWATERSTGRLKRDNIELLLHSIAIIYGFFDPEEHSLSELSDTYKKYIANLGADALEQFIKEIWEYAKLYREKIKEVDKNYLLDFEDFEGRLFHTLSVCEISTLHPYILYLYKTYDIQDEILRETFRKIERFVVRRMITGESTKNYNKYCKHFIEDNSKIDTMLAEISDDDIRRSMDTYINNKNATFLLFWVELFRRNQNRSLTDKDGLKYVYTLEHIMPVKWEEHWGNVPVRNINNGEIITNEDSAKTERKHHIFTIGNMTLLKGSLNTAVKNYDFKRKICGDGKTKKYIRIFAELNITKADIVEPFDNGDEVWDELKIATRTRKLTNELLQIWPSN